MICKSQSSLSSILLHPRWSWRRSREKAQECRQPRRPSWTKDTKAPLSPPRWTLSEQEERRQSSLKNLTTWTRKGSLPRGTCIPSNCKVLRSRSLSEWTPVLRISARSRSVQTPWKRHPFLLIKLTCAARLWCILGSIDGSKHPNLVDIQFFEQDFLWRKQWSCNLHFLHMGPQARSFLCAGWRRSCNRSWSCCSHLVSAWCSKLVKCSGCRSRWSSFCREQRCRNKTLCSRELSADHYRQQDQSSFVDWRCKTFH